MLTYVKIYEIILYPHYNACDVKFEEEEKMAESKLNNLNTSLRESAYYLISFFYKTGKKYSCTQTKLGKLLSILAFRYAVNGQRLFEETIYKYPPNCGTLIKEMTMIASKDVYIRSIINENPDNPSRVTDQIDNCIEIPTQFRSIDNLTSEIKLEIESLFIRFGAYPADVLGRLINPIVDNIVSPSSDEVILDKLFDLKRDSLNTDGPNDVIDYIFE